jgi:hypothetical protein
LNVRDAARSMTSGLAQIPSFGVAPCRWGHGKKHRMKSKQTTGFFNLLGLHLPG